jgi:hypothetical protein
VWRSPSSSNPTWSSWACACPSWTGSRPPASSRNPGPATQVVILTAYEGSLLEKSADDAGAYAYLVKGCSPKFVKAVLTEARNFKAGMEQLGPDRFAGGR